MSEKNDTSDLPAPVAASTQPAPARVRSTRFSRAMGYLLCGYVVFLASRGAWREISRSGGVAPAVGGGCVQPEPLLPEYDVSTVWDAKDRIVEVSCGGAR